MIHTIYLIRAIGFIVIGVTFASIIVETNILSRLGVLTKGICRISNLSHGSVLALLACIMSSTSGKSMLAEFYTRGEVGRTETTLTVLMSTFPVVLGESLFRIHAPIAVALLGPAVGGVYVLLTLFSAFVQTLGALIASRLLLPKRACPIGVADRSEDGSIALDWQTIKKGARQAYPTLRKIVPILVVSMLAIEFLLSLGAGIYITQAFAPVLNLLGLPGDVIYVLIAQFIHFTAGYATVQTLLLNDVITDKQAILTLLVGSMVVITMIYVKYSFSMYVSLFGKFGVTITAINYASSMIVKILMILLVVVWY
ncbi:MAG: nucleoside recognition domain-containing protein [Euryarchaeota archaeon]|nr:nucleoside recognition domain-containing protein [Euryarchaeota archaeon]